MRFADILPPKFKLGLVTFAGSASVVVPPTTNRAAVKAAVRNVELQERTAIGEAIYSSLGAIESIRVDGKERKVPATIVVMSDGFTNAGRPNAQAAAAAVKAKVPVSTISFGTQDGTVVVQGREVGVPASPDALKAIADATGGHFSEATTGQELQDAYEGLNSSIGFRDVQRDVTEWFVGFALALAFLAARRLLALDVAHAADTRLESVRRSRRSRGGRRRGRRGGAGRCRARGARPGRGRPRPASSTVSTTRSSPIPHASQSSLTATAHDTGGRSSSSAGWSSSASSMDRRMPGSCRRLRDGPARYTCGLQLKLFVRAVLDRYRVLRGREEAAAITLYGLFALFALTVLAIAVVGFIASRRPRRRAAHRRGHRAARLGRDRSSSTRSRPRRRAAPPRPSSASSASSGSGAASR